MQKAMFLSLTLVAVALAGCADDPPSGSFTATTPAVDYSVAGILVESRPPQNEYPGGNDTACDADQVGESDPTGQFPFACEDAQSTVSLTPEGGATLPLADNTTGYTLFIIDDEEGEFELGALEHHGEGHYDFPAQTYEGEDFSSATEVQLRFGATVVATADTPKGDFALAAGLENISADATFSGSEITVTTSGVPTDTPLVGWLVDVDESGVKTHGPQFILSSGETMYTLTEEEGFVGDYEEFHIHVGNSKINIAVAPIPSGSDE